MKNSEKKRVVAYFRVSSKTQTDNSSIPHQRTKINEYCKYKDYRLVKEYTEKGISGSNIETRPEYQKMIDFVCDSANKIDAIICYKSDRIHRELCNLVNMIKELEKTNVGFVSVAEDFDTSTITGRLTLHILGSFAEYERDTINERCQNGRKKKAADNEFLGGRMPYGYEYSKGNAFMVIEKEAGVVKNIFQYRADGYSFQKIATLLNKDGVVSKQGKKWNRQSVEYIVRNEAYTGKYKYNSDKEGNSLVYSIPRIVSKQLFNKANIAKRENKEVHELGFCFDNAFAFN